MNLFLEESIEELQQKLTEMKTDERVALGDKLFGSIFQRTLSVWYKWRVKLVIGISIVLFLRVISHLYPSEMMFGSFSRYLAFELSGNAF